MKYYILIIFLLFITFSFSTAQVLLDPATQEHFINDLPILSRADVTSGDDSLKIMLKDTVQDLGIVDGIGAPLLTTVWGYNFGSGTTYPGSTIVAKSNIPVNVTWVNELRNGYLFPVDTTVLTAFSDLQGVFNTTTRQPVAAVTHLHGGHTESISDGLGEAWSTPDYIYRGNDFLKTDDGQVTGNAIPFYYQNDQRASTLWYHDHTLGLDRLGVYSGLAGAYLIRDDDENSYITNNQIPSGPYEVELIIQDKMFTDDGQLYFPSEPEEPGQPAVSILPEFFGDFILVNGKAWPKLEVEPRPYRFRIVNGSDSRFYNLYLNDDKEPFAQIGTDGGLFEAPVNTEEVLVGPAMRADIVIDFTNFAGDTVVLHNDAKTPFPDGDDITASASEIMAFIVSKPLDGGVPKAVLPVNFTPFVAQPTPSLTRQLVMFEAEDEFDRLKPSLGTVAGGVMGMMDPVTETPSLNSTEIWELFNATEDAHPIHLHLVHFRVINTQPFTADVDPVNGRLTNIVLQGSPTPPSALYQGWKDTDPMFPGEVTRIQVTFDRAGKYMWHCHILSHEDHEMMRPFVVVDATAIAENTLHPNASMLLAQNVPNPFSSSSQISFTLSKDEHVALSIYNLQGRKVVDLINEAFPRGSHTVTIDGDALSAGLYYCNLQTKDGSVNRKIEVIK